MNARHFDFFSLLSDTSVPVCVLSLSSAAQLVTWKQFDLSGKGAQVRKD